MKKKTITTIIILLFFLVGLSLLLYPFVANQWNNYRQSRLISSYDNGREPMLIMKPFFLLSFLTLSQWQRHLMNQTKSTWLV